ncbi:DUF680 domain-containing protein [Aminobacter ciceronei]|uniref:DUF680 domain-containing protein n=1 Tax=Aminobacter ciceronei TaxID=150723 RepID=A0ABR6C8J2_9HYPH|nr:DUF680 domain-containing protein [Aminobacter ciceronei]MBA8907565.1 hypothetical protein [Aminobacter ciceronei]MBA9021334.1 hypothetical protein [Aminobacter ciceronei]
MTKIALTAAAFLVATGTAFAGSDSYGSNNANQQVADIDNSFTASIQKSDTAQVANTKLTTQSGQGIWGR